MLTLLDYATYKVILMLTSSGLATYKVVWRRIKLFATYEVV